MIGPRCRRSLDIVARLFRSKSGGVALSFAFMILPVIVVIGGGIDYVMIQQTRTKLDTAADAASLGAIGKTSISLTTSAAQTLAAQVFNAELTTTLKSYVKTSTSTVTDTGTTRTSVFTYSATVPTSFLKLIGMKSMVMTGSSTATTVLPTYIDFYLLLDNTPSMGLAATTAGIATMEAHPDSQCAFACHDVSSYPNDNYALAKKLGVPMRIDVVRSAVQNLMDTASKTEAVTNQFRMAIYTFGAKAEARQLTTISALTNDLAAAKTSANVIDLMSVPYQNYNSDRDTDFDGILTSINAKIPNPGSGALPSSTPQKYLFFVSDGVADAAYSAGNCSQALIDNSPRCQEPLTVANCTTIKNRGIKIAVLYTTYLPVPKDDWYSKTVAPWASKIAPNMKACASPGLFFEVSPTEGISAAMNALFAKAVQSAYLSK